MLRLLTLYCHLMLKKFVSATTMFVVSKLKLSRKVTVSSSRWLNVLLVVCWLKILMILKLASVLLPSMILLMKFWLSGLKRFAIEYLFAAYLLVSHSLVSASSAMVVIWLIRLKLKSAKLLVLSPLSPSVSRVLSLRCVPSTLAVLLVTISLRVCHV